MKILILTDSSSLPREKPEFCDYKTTWPVLIKEKHEVHQVSIGAATSEILLRQITYQKHFNPEIVIIQVGLADCAPRFMSRKELDFTSLLGKFGKSIRFLFNRRWVRKFRQISYTNEADFRVNMNKIKSSFDCPLFVIGIIPPTADYQYILPGIESKVVTYNDILKKVSDVFIDTSEIGEGIMSDHMHINSYGQRFIYEKIMELIKEYEK